jgi:uncharacterized protein (DUF1810 family)
MTIARISRRNVNNNVPFVPRESAEAVLSVQGRLASDIFGHPDDWKLQSSMTLFELVSSPDSVFGRVLDKYYQGKRDSRTLRIVGKA